MSENKIQFKTTKGTIEIVDIAGAKLIHIYLNNYYMGQIIKYQGCEWKVVEQKPFFSESEKKIIIDRFLNSI